MHHFVLSDEVHKVLSSLWYLFSHFRHETKLPQYNMPLCYLIDPFVFVTGVKTASPCLSVCVKSKVQFRCEKKNQSEFGAYLFRVSCSVQALMHGRYEFDPRYGRQLLYIFIFLSVAVYLWGSWGLFFFWFYFGFGFWWGFFGGVVVVFCLFLFGFFFNVYLFFVFDLNIFVVIVVVGLF